MKLFQLIIILLFSISTFGQVTYNHVVDSANLETRAVMDLFENYLNSNPQDKQQNPFWSSQEQQRHKNFDFLESEFQPSLYMGFPVHVLSIKSIKGSFQIKAQFSYCQPDGTPYILAIVNYIAKRENGQFKLFNWLTESKQNWNCTNVGLVEFYHPEDHKFDYDKANQLNEFVISTCKNLGVQPKPFEYYLADDYDEIQQLKGIEYYLGMGGESLPSGKANDNKVYCGGLGEYYPHEVFHVQIDEHFPNKHFWVSEGMATFLGGSRGKDLDWHIKRTHNYLKDHPEVNLSDMLKLTNLDNQTAYHYVLGGLIAKRVFEKGGWNLIREFMTSGKKDEDYYAVIEKHLGVPQSGLNDYLRNELEMESGE